MLNLNKRNTFVEDLISHSYNRTKIRFFFSTKSVGDDFDPYEKNYEYTSLNPITISAFSRTLSPESLIWKQYGLSETGAIEVIMPDKYGDWVRNCNKIEVDGDTYQVYKENVGNRCIITKIPFKLLKIVLRKLK